MMKSTLTLIAALGLSAAGLTAANAADLQAQMRRATATGPGEVLGTVTVSPATTGTAFKVDVHGLPPGPHGFHVHANDSCETATLNGAVVPAGAAGGHLDPDKTGKHEGPLGDGHLGDLPVLAAGADGSATETVDAPRIKDMEMLKGHALMIHVGGDTYSDTPAPLGGGGARLACGVLE